MCESNWHEKVVLKPFQLCTICGSESFHSPDPDYDEKVMRKKKEIKENENGQKK
jgi:hypothetical protein